MRLSWPLKAVLLALVAGGAFLMVTPFLYMISIALTRYAYTVPYPPRLIPDAPTLENFVRAWTSNNFVLYTFNSLFISAATVLGVLLIASITAYGFARFEFPGREILFRGLLFSMMVPNLVALIPTFLVMRDLNLIDSRFGLIMLYVSTGIAGHTFLLRAFFSGLPRELEDAVRVDGGGRWTIYRHIILPLSQPALATVAIWTFLGAWEEYFWALTLLKDEAKRTLPIAVRLFSGLHATNFGVVFAFSAIVLVPSILIFVFGQRYFVQGLSSGGVKG